MPSYYFVSHKRVGDFINKVGVVGIARVVVLASQIQIERRVVAALHTIIDSGLVGDAC